MNKKIIMISLLLLMSFILTSCGRAEATNNTINTKKIEVDSYTLKDVADALLIATEKAKQSVVALVDNNGLMTSLGSAVIIKRINYEGLDETDDVTKATSFAYYAITNNHVVRDSVKLITRVYLSDHVDDPLYSPKVKVVETDAALDLAIVRFDTSVYLPVAEIKSSSSLSAGQMVIAIGTPVSLTFYNTVTHGVISSPLRYVDDENNKGYFIQHDAPINPGNSGGGLFDLEGKLVGINTWRLINVKEEIINMNFAIPTDVIYTKYASYIEKYMN